MKRLSPRSRSVTALLTLLLVSPLVGCTAYKVGGAIQSGRAELRYGDPKVALAYFQHAAELDPDYRFSRSLWREGVWTYVGKAHYALGNRSKARAALERARELHPDDPIARLYLGLVLAREGEQDRAIREIVAGLSGVKEWLEYADFNLSDGRFWDIDRRFRNRIDKTLETISTGEFVWPELISEAEWLGKELEEEIERARRRQLRDRRRDDDDQRRDRDRDRGSRSRDRGSRGRR
ncbi:MAG: tetratricopeptide repeat protein [Candidatus Binatia bacterium]